ncbi:MAG: hypothetical protein HQM13_16305 [SAR324 cluster bacterium]|nr:hypothetical protein [SAR324 cluster bacterium]
MQDTSLKQAVDRQILNIAIKNFLEHGGQIKVLPPQKVAAKAVISRQEWTAYESLSDFAG